MSSRNLQIININGLVPGKASIQLQSAPDIDALWTQLGNYVARSLIDAGTTTDIEIIQKVFGRKASIVPELAPYDFEENQRVDELLVTIAIARSTNALTSSNMIPAWQKHGQDAAMVQFNGKVSWDGFIYEHVPMIAYTPGRNISPIPIEVKSLKVHPHKEKFTSLNNLLEKKLPKFSKFFQKEGSIAAVLVFPIGVGHKDEQITFMLDHAAVMMNQFVSRGAIGCLVFVEIIKDANSEILVSLKCTFISKNPRIGTTPNPAEFKLFESKLVRFRYPEPLESGPSSEVAN